MSEPRKKRVNKVFLVRDIVVVMVQVQLFQKSIRCFLLNISNQNYHNTISLQES